MRSINRMSRLLMSAVVLGGAFIVTTGSVTATEQINIDLIAPFSGPVSFYGPTIRQGFELALKEAGTSIGDRKIVITNLDDECKPEKAIMEANRVIESTTLIVGPVCTGGALAISGLMVEEKIPHIFTGYGSVVTGKKNPFVLAATVSDKVMAEAVVRWALENRGIKRWTIIHDTSGYGASSATTFEQAVKATSGTTLAQKISFNPGEREFAGLLTNAAKDSPDGIYVIGYEVDLGILVRQTGQTGIKGQIIGSAAFVNPDLGKAAGSHAEGIPFVTMMLPNDANPDVKAFVEKFTKEYGSTPKDTATIGYIAGLMVADGLKRISGKVTRDNLMKALKATDIKHSPVGPIKFDENGARVGEKLAVIGIIKDSAPSFLTRY